MARKSRTEIAADVPDPSAELAQGEYEALAGFRFELRKFMAFSQKAAEARGIKPQQYQALLAIRARGGQGGLALNELAHELFIGLSTAVELANRLQSAGLITRETSDRDKRRTLLQLTAKADEALKSLATVHRDELREQVPALISLLSRIQGR